MQRATALALICRRVSGAYESRERNGRFRASDLRRTIRGTYRVRTHHVL